MRSFDVDEYVLFFLREKSLEQVAEGQDENYARVVRVCKSDSGAVNLGNQWSSMRKTRLTCVYNNTYLNDLEDVIQITDELFVGLFSLKLPGRNSVSFLCEFKKQSLLSGLNSGASNFKEIVPGTQYWSKISPDKAPKNIPNQCNYNSQQLKDDAINFIKTHSLIGDHIEGNMLHFISDHVVSVAHETVVVKQSNQFGLENKPEEDMKINVFYLGTSLGKILKISSFEPKKVISEWMVSIDPIEEIKINHGESLFAATDSAIYQIDINAQCSKYYTCGFCMSDPHCGWNIRTNTCENTKSNVGLISLNYNLCSRLERQENIRAVQVESGSSTVLECNVKDEYFFGGGSPQMPGGPKKCPNPLLNAF